jgi:hypothetical protein
MLGEFDRVLETPGLMPFWRINTLIRLDRLADALRVEDAAYPVLLYMGRAAELLETPGVKPSVANEALVSLGRLQEAAGDGVPQVPGSGSSPTAMLLLGQLEMAERIGKQPRPAIRLMRAAEVGDGKAYAELHERIQLPPDLGATTGWFAPIAMLPFVDAMRGDRQAIERLRPQLPLLDGVFGRTPWFVARVLLGEAPPASLDGMPSRYDAPAWRLVVTGMRAELNGRRDEARSAYAAFAAMPMHRRLLAQQQPDPDVEWFVAWRQRALQVSP